MRYEDIPYRNSKALLNYNSGEFNIHLNSLETYRDNDRILEGDAIAIEFTTSSPKEIEILNSIERGYDMQLYIYFTLLHLGKTFKNGVITEIKKYDDCTGYKLMFNDTPSIGRKEPQELYECCINYFE